MVQVVMDYTVHSSDLVEAPVKAMVNGVEVEAKVPRLVVELISNDGEHGHTFRLPITGPVDVVKWARAMKVGQGVTLTLDVGDPA